jgi:site-specific DNA recombinase
MLTVAYCRVSTEEQATDGFSIEGQADRLRQYADLHDLGPVTVIMDPGRSGKDLNRPGLIQLLGMVDEGHVSNVLIWRLDRLSRNLGDLIGLADRFGQADVSLHSFTERLDLSSATGRMFYNILGSFAQFYREQLAENVRLGMRQAAREGRWTNHPPTGYDLVDGVLITNDDADTVKRIYRLRAEGMSQAEISRHVGIGQSTVLAILKNRAYLGKVKCGDEWVEGLHEALITEQQFQAAHRGNRPGIRRGKDLMSGRVRCGICKRSMSVMDNGAGWMGYRCWHRGKGCDVPRFSNKGLLLAALLALREIRDNDELQTAIRSQLDRRSLGRQDQGRRRAERTRQIAQLEEKRRKLLELYYADRISPDGFHDEEHRIATQLNALTGVEDPEEMTSDLAEQFEHVLAILAGLDWDLIWEAATDSERRVLLDEFVPQVEVHPDHLEVELRGVPRLNVALHEVGLRNRSVENSGVGGGT